MGRRVGIQEEVTMNMIDHKKKPKRLIIFEGPDCGGKTTVMREFRQTMADVTEVHHGPYPRLTSAQLPRFYVDSMMPLLHQYEHMLMDRCWLSERIYGRVFRNGTDRIGLAARHLERIAMRHGAVVVLCLPPWEKVKEQWLKRKKADSDAEYLDRIDQLETVYAMYELLEFSTDLPVIRYDYTVHSNQTVMLRNLVDKAAMPLHVPHGSAGNADAKVILVGDKPSDHADTDTLMQWPFCSFSRQGSSMWLAEQLAASGISEADLFWLNADTGVWQIKEMYARPVIALGNNASDKLTQMGIAHLKAHHPQAHKRFNSSEPYELIAMIKSALKK